MSEYGMDVTSPVGRIVWGSPTKPRPVKHQDGPQKGQPKLDANNQPIMEISFGVAFAKADFQNAIWPVMSAEIATGYPNGVPPRFAYKYADGDGIDPDGQPYNLREGYPGCYVLAYTQRINATFPPPPIYRYNAQSGRYDQLGADDIKCGDYVTVGTNFKVNVATGTNTPSVYVNPKAIELVGYGTPIVSAGGVDPNAMFGNRQHQLPPGASATPMQAPGAPGMPGMAPAAAPGGMPGAPGQMPGYPPAGAPAPMQAPGYPPQAAPGGYPQQPAMQPQGAPGMAPPAYQPQPTMQPQGAPMQAPGGYPPPAPDFVAGAPMAAPGGYPQPAPGYPPQGAPMQAPGGYPQPGAPGAMPGMMPGR